MAESNTSEQRKYRVTVGELRKIAEVISDASVKAPASVLAVARRAISLRKDVTSWFMHRGDSASNKSHAHFIMVMEEICTALEWQTTGDSPSPSVSKRKNHAKAKAAAAEETNAQDWLNRFATLTVEETEDLPESVPHRGELVKAEAVDDDNGEDEDYLSDAFFRVLCLFHDLQKWRTFLAQTVRFFRRLPAPILTFAVDGVQE